MSEPPEARGAVDIGDATRQLEQAAHNTRVALDCIVLGDLDRAHAHAITARNGRRRGVTILGVALESAPSARPPDRTDG